VSSNTPIRTNRRIKALPSKSRLGSLSSSLSNSRAARRICSDHPPHVQLVNPPTRILPLFDSPWTRSTESCRSLACFGDHIHQRAKRSKTHVSVSVPISCHLISFFLLCRHKAYLELGVQSSGLVRSSGNLVGLGVSPGCAIKREEQDQKFSRPSPRFLNDTSSIQRLVLTEAS
jgi:hypothetical protein